MPRDDFSQVPFHEALERLRGSREAARHHGGPAWRHGWQVALSNGHLTCKLRCGLARRCECGADLSDMVANNNTHNIQQHMAGKAHRDAMERLERERRRPM